MKLQILILLFPILTIAQLDSTKYPWPVTPLYSSQSLTATFGEFRNTGSSDHFHNAVDIGEPDGNPVYPSIDGIVHYFSNNGYDSYINVKSIINGEKKHITYYHVVPSPTLTLNQSVTAGTSIIGTIYVGAAHVHLIERELLSIFADGYGNEINPVRPEGGLTPYYDTYSPVINSSSLTFYKDRSAIKLPSDNLHGKVDIKIEVRERNGTSSSHINNGTYILGYRLLSSDGTQIIYEPENDGIKYRFYTIPLDSYSHSVFVDGEATLSDPIYWLTNGNGEKEINKNFTVPNNYLNTDLLDDGNYLLEIFAEDTRANKTSQTFPITISKLPPELTYVLANEDFIKISWEKYIGTNLLGYRIYYSELSDSSWNLAANELTLDKESSNITFNTSSNFLVPTSEQQLKYYIVAIDSAGNESTKSDVYSTISKNDDSQSVLIVDGFDRIGNFGSWDKLNHKFNLLYAQATQEAPGSYNISSCSNEAVINDSVKLENYDFVFWFLGDESFEDNTVVNKEQYMLATFLQNGGKLFISGEDIGYDLDTKHDYTEDSDTLFYHQYLKSKLMHDGLDLLFEVNGETNSVFEGLNVKFGETYASDSPDDIEPINGGVPIFNYTYVREDSLFRKGGVSFNGIFKDGIEEGALVYLSFPFETIGNLESRNSLMEKILQQLKQEVVGIKDEKTNPTVEKNYSLEQNYPNPFNPNTIINYSIKNNGHTTLRIFDILGRHIKTLVNDNLDAGSHNYIFNATEFSSGVYYYQLVSGNYIETKKMILLK